MNSDFVKDRSGAIRNKNIAGYEQVKLERSRMKDIDRLKREIEHLKTEVQELKEMLKCVLSQT